MAVTKMIEIDGKPVEFKASAAIPRIYRNRFGRDVYKDLMVLNDTIERALEQAHFDPERPQEKHTKKADRESGVQLVRYYPVYKGETEKQAYLRKLE